MDTNCQQKNFTTKNMKSTTGYEAVKSVAEKSVRSFHHRMARLIRDAYEIKCQVPGCQFPAGYICEWDHMQFGKPVTGTRVYCDEHAGNFALKHNIYMATLPDVLLSELETASRDDWKYSDDRDGWQYCDADKTVRYENR